jgi:hypothetical protein
VSTSCLPPAAHKNSHAHATDGAQFTITIGCLFILLHTNPWRTRNRPDPPDVDPGSRLFAAFSSSIRIGIGLFIFAMRSTENSLFAPRR